MSFNLPVPSPILVDDDDDDDDDGGYPSRQFGIPSRVRKISICTIQIDAVRICLNPEGINSLFVYWQITSICCQLEILSGLEVWTRT